MLDANTIKQETTAGELETTSLKSDDREDNFTSVTQETLRARFLKSFGGIGKEIGRGREKTAREVGKEKVLVEYHGQENRMLATEEYVKAQFYLHKILHSLLPNNFPDVFAAGTQAILVERVPDNEDFIRAKELNKKFLSYELRSLVTSEEREWIDKKARDTLTNEEFDLAYRVLDCLGLGTSPNNNRDELALPINTVYKDGHPVLIEMLKPIHTNNEGVVVPCTDIDVLAQIVKSANEHGVIDEKTMTRILSYSLRFIENAKLAAKSAQEMGLVVR